MRWLQRNLCQSKKKKIIQKMELRLYILAINVATKTAEWKVLRPALGYFEPAVTLQTSSDCFRCRESRAGRQKERSLSELSRRLPRTPPPWKHKHGTVQREPPTHPRYAWLCSSCIYRGCLWCSEQYVDAAFPPSMLCLTPGHPDGGAQGPSACCCF